MDIETIRKVFNNFHLGSRLLIEDKPKYPQCRYCGYEFQQIKGQIRMHLDTPDGLYTCTTRYERMSPKKKFKMFKKYRKTPWLCPICNKPQKNEGKSDRIICRQCGAVIPYPNYIKT